MPGAAGGPMAARLRPRVSDLLFGTLNFMPTLLDLMGLVPPATCQGRNLAAAIRSGDDRAVESVPLFHFAGNWRGVYTRRCTPTPSTFPTVRSAKTHPGRPGPLRLPLRP